MKNIINMIKYLKGTHRKLTLLLVFSIIRAALYVYVPFIFRDIINEISRISNSSGQNSFNQIYRSLIILAAVLLIERLMDFFNEKFSDTVRMDAITILRQAIFPKLMELSVSFIEKERPGALAQKVNQGIYDFMDWVWNFNEWLSMYMISSIFIVVVLMINNIYVGLVLLAVCILMILINMRKVKKTKPYNNRANNYFEKYNAQLTESLSHVATIKTLSAQNKVNSLFNQTTESIRKYRLIQFKIQRRHNTVRDTLGTIGLLAGVVIISTMATKGKYSPGDILLVAYLTRDLVLSMVPISRFVDQTGNTEVTSARLLKLLDTKPLFEDRPDAVNLSSLQSIKFDKVSFNYPDSPKKAIRDISFEINKGKTVALVGPSGVGKSTLTNLILRFYLPTDGKILINDAVADTFTQDSIREKIAIVMQDVALFNTSVLENIRLAKPNASEKEIIEAAKLAYAHDFIAKLTDGYDTVVGERGVKLSGGQKQRIAIARAILKNPDLIILDEATSALDSFSEKLVQEGLEQLMKGRMALVVAHRLSTVRHADEIIVLEKGSIEERGLHQELLKSKGLYAKLYKMQAETGRISL